ncbi:MAG TPA: heavy metal-associated domain-containing protein [Parasegetibacter sp.]
MIHSYNITGMTCTGCQTKVQKLLSAVPHVKKVEIDLKQGKAQISMDQHIDTSTLQTALKDYPKYQISEEPSGNYHQQKDNAALKSSSEHGIQHQNHPQIDWAESNEYSDDFDLSADKDTQTWFQTYKPILLVFSYILTATLLIEINGFNQMRWMNNFMAGFFLVFSFFKLIDLRGFAENYSSYDIIAKRWRGWGYLYAFIELALGLAFLSGFNPIVTNAVTFVVMTISIIGVLQSVLNKQKIKCACLGAVFNLPMSTITIIEDALMIAMSGIMLSNML